MILAYKSTFYNIFSHLSPGYGRPRPPGQGGSVDAPVHQVYCLLATIKQELRFARVRCPGRLVLHQNVGRAAQVRVFDVECHLVRRQVDLAPAFDHL